MTSTVGDATGALDAQSAAWFTAACTGLKPAAAEIQALPSLSSSTGSSSDLDKLLVALGAMGKSFTDTATTLKTLPPPTIKDGSSHASQIIAALEKSGSALTNEVAQITKDPSALSSAIETVTSSITTAVKPMNELDAPTLAAIDKLPACSSVAGALGG